MISSLNVVRHVEVLSIMWTMSRITCCVLLALSGNTRQQLIIQVLISWVGQSMKIQVQISWVGQSTGGQWDPGRTCTCRRAGGIETMEKFQLLNSSLNVSVLSSVHMFIFLPFLRLLFTFPYTQFLIFLWSTFSPIFRLALVEIKKWTVDTPWLQIPRETPSNQLLTVQTL